MECPVPRRGDSGEILRYHNPNPLFTFFPTLLHYKLQIPEIRCTTEFSAQGSLGTKVNFLELLPKSPHVFIHTHSYQVYIIFEN